MEITQQFIVFITNSKKIIAGKSYYLLIINWIFNVFDNPNIF